MRRRPSFRERVAAVAASRAREEAFLREMLARYPAGSDMAEDIAGSLARHLGPQPAIHRYADLFGMPPLMHFMGADHELLDPLWEKAIARGRAASLREMYAVLAIEPPPEGAVI